MGKTAGFDFEKTTDCFQKTEHIRSDLFQGDPDVIPEPLFTVLITTSKREQRKKLLKGAIISALSQRHVDFFWEIIVLDNEAYDGRPNDAEKLIKEMDNPRILYYRNSEQMLPGDNYNRGFKLARGKWVMMLHDDDLLTSDALYRMEQLIKSYSCFGKPIGAITASYIPFRHDAESDYVMGDLSGYNNVCCSLPANYGMYQVTRSSEMISFFFGNPPTNGSTFNRQAVMETGGFDTSKGTCTDIALLYQLEKKYTVYITHHPMGLYRFGYNTLSNKETIESTIREYEQICDSLFSRDWRSRLLGFIIKEDTYQTAIENYINRLNVGYTDWSPKKIRTETYAYIHPKQPSAVKLVITELIIVPLYNIHKKRQGLRLAKKASKVNA